MTPTNSIACKRRGESVPFLWSLQTSDSSTTAKHGWNQRKYAPKRSSTTGIAGKEKAPSALSALILARFRSASHWGTKLSALTAFGTGYRNLKLSRGEGSGC